LITVTTLLGVMAAAIASMLATPMYTATATTFVSVNGGSSPDVATALQGSLFAQDRVKSYVDIVTADEVMGTVIDDLGLNMSPNELAGKIDVNNPLDTVTLQISATDPKAQNAQNIANATAKALQAQVNQLEQPVGGGDALVKITVTEPAPLPGAPSSPRTKINLALGFLVGLAIGVGAAVLLETLDTRIKSIEALAKHFEQPLLGVIGFDPDAAKSPLLTSVPTQNKRAESFRQVRTNLQFVDIDHRPKSIVVTSSVPREGKTTTAVNLAITIAQTGQPVFLIEGDLRRPKVADYLGIEGMAGLTDVLVGRATVDEVLQPWGTTGNLWIMAAGPLPPNPSELLGSQAMADLIRHLEKRATLIIDAPPLLPVTDGAVLTRLSGGAIMIVRTGKTRREQLRTAEQNIESVGGKILGLVLNMAPPRGPDSHRYGYGYQYDYSSIANRGRYEDHAPVIPAGLGGLPGVNGSPMPTTPVGPVPTNKKSDDAPAEPLPRPASQASVEAVPPSEGDGLGRPMSRPKAPPPSNPGSSSGPAAPAAPVGAPGPVAPSAPETPSSAPAAPEASARLHSARGQSSELSSTTTRSAPELSVTTTEIAKDVPELKTATPPEEKVIGGAAGVPLEAAISPYGHREPKADLLPADTASGARFGLDDDAPLTDIGEVPVGGSVTASEAPRPPELTGWTPPPPRAALDPLTAPYEQLQRQQDVDPESP
jgi:capsular exopolysaccharide synthesis family protein